MTLPPRFHRLAALPAALVFAPALLAPAVFAQDITNAPVAPETIYISRGGDHTGLSVIDLNGFGASTGNPQFDPTGLTFQEGWSNYVNNPNLKVQGAQLGLGLPTSTLNGGSSGVFTLTRNSALDDLLLGAPQMRSSGDMMIGWPLDIVFNSGPPPFGCSSGAPNLCETNGLQLLNVGTGGSNSVVPVSPGSPTLNSVVAGGNPISFAPSPNPPPLTDQPQCFDPFVGGAKPIGDVPFTNLLAPGDAQGNPLLGVPPSGRLAAEQNSYFVGPADPQITPSNCATYSIRQQLGHFLYVVDERANEIVAVNSNTFTVLDRIAVADPTELAMSPDLRFLGVTNRATDSVSFISIDPSSASFHSVVKTTAVGDGPVGIAWDPGGEDLIVCNERDNSISIISGFNLEVRKVLTRGLSRPFAVAITQRQESFGHDRGVYYAYILDRAGHVSLFESGPGGVGGIGFDSLIGRTEYAFENPRAIQPDPLSLNSAVWIAHEGQLDGTGQPTGLGGGAVTQLRLESVTAGPLVIQPGERPNLRGLTLEVALSVGSDQLTGTPLDLAFDNLVNLGALPNVGSAFSSSPPVALNGKSQVRNFGGTLANTSEAAYLFVPVRDPAATGAPWLGTAVDVIDLATGQRVDVNAFQPGVQSIPAPGVRKVADYFRQ